MPKMRVRDIKKDSKTKLVAPYLSNFSTLPLIGDEIEVTNKEWLKQNWEKIEGMNLLKENENKSLISNIISLASGIKPDEFNEARVRNTITALQTLEKNKIKNVDTKKLMKSEFIGDLLDSIEEGRLSEQRAKVLADNASNIDSKDKAAAVARYMNNLSRTDLKLTSKSKRLEGFMSLNYDQMNAVNTVLDAYSTPRPGSLVADGLLDRDTYDAIIRNADKLTEKGAADSLAATVRLLADNNMRFAPDRLEKTIEDGNLKEVNQLLTALKDMKSGELDIARASIVVANAKNLNSDKMASLIGCVQKINGQIPLTDKNIKIPLTEKTISLNSLFGKGSNSNLKTLMSMDNEKLTRVNSLFGNMDKISQQRFNAIVNAVNSNPQVDTENLVTCLKQLEGSKIPLSPNIEKLTGLDKMGRASKEQRLSELAVETTNLHEIKAGFEAELAELEEKMSSMTALTSDPGDAERLVALEKEIEQTQAQIDQRTQQTQEVNNKPGPLTVLAQALGEMDKGKLTDKRFDVLMKNVSLLEANNNGKEIGQYMTAMSRAGLPLTDGNNRLEKMMDKTPRQIEYATHLIASINTFPQGAPLKSPLTSSKYDIIVKHISSMDQDKANGAGYTIQAMNKTGMYVGSAELEKIMKTNPQECGDLIKFLTEKDRGRGRERVETIVENARHLDSGKMEAMKQCISMLEEKNVPLTRNDTLKTLMSMNKNELETLNTLLNNMDDHVAPKEAFQAIGSQLPKLRGARLDALSDKVNKLMDDDKALIAGAMDRLTGKNNPIDVAIREAQNVRVVEQGLLAAQREEQQHQAEVTGVVELKQGEEEAHEIVQEDRGELEEQVQEEELPSLELPSGTNDVRNEVASRLDDVFTEQPEEVKSDVDEDNIFNELRKMGRNP